MAVERTENAQQKPECSNNKNVPWYKEDITDIPEPTRQLLEEYSGIPPDRLKEHVLTVVGSHHSAPRENPPSICMVYHMIDGLFKFLDLSISHSPFYPEVLSRLKRSGQTLLDLGCCFGQDVRKLIFDGAPADQIYGADLHGEFIDVGYQLFQDGDRRRSNFFVADVFDRDHPDLTRLESNIDIIHAASFIHLFDYQGQVDVSKRLVRLLRPMKDAMVLGRQVGNLQPGEFPHNAADTGTMFRHDDKTFAEMWKRVGTETGSSWRVEVQLKEISTVAGRSTSGVTDDPNSRYLLFAVRREE